MYRDIFREENFPVMNNEIVLDQFIRNNWDNKKLVYSQNKTDKFGIDYSKGELTVSAAHQMDGTVDNFMVELLRSKKYMSTPKWVQVKDANGSTRNVKTTVLWKQVFAGDEMLKYEQVKPLGNNGEYLEMDVTDIKNPLTDTTEPFAQEESSTIKDNSQTETDASAVKKIQVSETQKERKFNTVKEKFVNQIIENKRKRGITATLADVEKQLENIKQDIKTPSGVSKWAPFLNNILDQIGIKVDMEKTIEEFNKYC
jgi:hypothetical protein